MSWTNMMLDLASIPTYNDTKDEESEDTETVIHNPSDEEELKALLKL